MLLGQPLHEVDQPLVSLVPLPQDVSDRELPLLFGLDGVERVDATVGHGVPWRTSADDDVGEMGKRLPFPSAYVSDDVLHRPTTRNTELVYLLFV